MTQVQLPDSSSGMESTQLVQPAPADDSRLLRLSIAAYLARYKGLSRAHAETDLRHLRHHHARRRRWTCEMSRSPHGTPTHARPCDTTEHDTTSTDTPTTSSPPTLPPEPESDRAARVAASPNHADERALGIPGLVRPGGTPTELPTRAASHAREVAPIIPRPPHGRIFQNPRTNAGSLSTRSRALNLTGRCRGRTGPPRSPADSSDSDRRSVDLPIPHVTTATRMSPWKIAPPESPAQEPSLTMRSRSAWIPLVVTTEASRYRRSPSHRKTGCADTTLPFTNSLTP